MRKQFLLLFQKQDFSEEERTLLTSALKDLLGISKINFETNYSFVFYQHREIHAFDLLSMLNSDLYLNIKGIEAEIEDEIEPSFLNELISFIPLLEEEKEFYFTLKILLRNHIQKTDEIMKKQILKTYYNDKESMNMLRVFFECNMNTSKSSDLLYVHRNTLINKIDRFIEETGYDIRKFEDAVIIYSLLK